LTKDVQRQAAERRAIKGGRYSKGEIAMRYNPDFHHRRSIRLKGYDYAQVGGYFITICAAAKICRFGEIHDGVMTPSATGEIVRSVWFSLPERYPSIALDAFVLMPNHLHGILTLSADEVKPPTIPQVVGAFKSLSVRAVSEAKNGEMISFWHRNYHEHIIRNKADLTRIRKYIEDNPARWHEDLEYPTG